MSLFFKDSAHNGSPNGEPLSLEAPSPPRKRGFVIAWCLIAIIAFIGFFMLGTWQLERRVWKLALIERVEQRVKALPIAAPKQAEWSQITVDSHEYLHVQTQGKYQYPNTTFVQASTNLGTGYWALTPLAHNDGSFTLINRGFVTDKEAFSAQASDEKPVSITGLLRINEPGGSRLRKNEPAHERWFSRDIGAIAEARKINVNQLAPYFIDIDYSPTSPPTEPVGGLTIISFYNHHLVYALTWYTLALMVAGATAYLLRQELSKRV